MLLNNKLFEILEKIAVILSKLQVAGLKLKIIYMILIFVTADL